MDSPFVDYEERVGRVEVVWGGSGTVRSGISMNISLQTRKKELRHYLVAIM